MSKRDWKGKHYAFFQNRECEYFPCHETDDLDNFNCLFCYCPLYALADKCGGNFKFTESGIKVCTGCIIPHKRENFGYIISRFNEIQDLVIEQVEKNKKEDEEE